MERVATHFADIVRKPALSGTPGLSSEQMRIIVGDIVSVVEQAVETMRALHQEGEESRHLAGEYKDQIEAQRSAFQSELQMLGGHFVGLKDRLQRREDDAAEAKSIAQAAIDRCREAESREAHAIARAKAAELRAGQAEQWLAAVLRTVETEFADIGTGEAP